MRTVPVILGSLTLIGCAGTAPEVTSPANDSDAERRPVIIGSKIERSRLAAGAAAATAPEPEEKPDTIQVREWRHWERDYKDRNGDGIVDWQAEGSARLTDGYGIYKEDNDFDGFYEREYEAGGFRYEVIRDETIRERVPAIHRVYRPTRIRKIPKPN